MKNHALFERNSLMETAERDFIMQMIKQYKPKKILTIGIAAGANEAMILDYLEQNDLLDSVTLYSADYSLNFYDGQDDTGFLVKECVPHLESYFHFFAPGLVANHLRDIGKDIELCIIDTMHYTPGEALDFLLTLPFLAKNAMVIMHDLITHHFYTNTEWRLPDIEFKDMNVCSVLFNALSGQKIYPKPYLYHKLTTCDLSYKPLRQNIGACVLSDNQLEDSVLESYFRVLNLPWYYMPSDEDLRVATEHFLHHYDEKYARYFTEIIQTQKKWVEDYKKSYHSLADAKEMQKIKRRLSYKIDRAISKAYKASGARNALKKVYRKVCRKV